jgi:hypothetical protein
MVSAKTVRRIGAAALIVPGIDHLISPTLTMIFAPIVMETMLGAGWISATVFFIVLGLFQLTWIGVLLKSKKSSLLALGVVGNLISILIYFISITGVTNFGVPPQPLVPFAVLIKALEAVSLLTPVYLVKTERFPSRKTT